MLNKLENWQHCSDKYYYGFAVNNFEREDSVARLLKFLLTKEKKKKIDNTNFVSWKIGNVAV